jgi:hypothetical protein
MPCYIKKIERGGISKNKVMSARHVPSLENKRAEILLRYSETGKRKT